MRKAAISDPAEMKAAWEARHAWHEDNLILLKKGLPDSPVIHQYSWYPGSRSFGKRPPPLADQIDAFRTDMVESLSRLRSVLQDLPPIEEPAPIPPPAPGATTLRGVVDFEVGRRYDVYFNEWHSENTFDLRELTFVAPIWVGWPDGETEVVGYFFVDAGNHGWFVSDQSLMKASESV